MSLFSKLKEKFIKKETTSTKEEKEDSMGKSRRNGLLSNSASHIVDLENIVGYIDKEHQKIILNPKFKKDISITM